MIPEQHMILLLIGFVIGVLVTVLGTIVALILIYNGEYNS